MRSSPCVTCVRRITKKLNEDVVVCEAFPGGIPDEILEARNQHRQAFKGDGGLRWKPLSGFEYLDTPEEIQEHEDLPLTDENDSHVRV